MLWEIWQFITTPCPPHLREMNYLKEFIGIASRHKRSKKAWKPHLRETKNFILNAANRCKQNGTALVLGSGWLLDIPLKELAGRFKKVYLVDVIHPNSVRKKTRKFSNITLLEAEITGIVQPLLELKEKHSNTKPSLPTPPVFEPKIDDKIDFVISANILSQLPILPMEFVRKHFRHNESELRSWKRLILQKHLEFLQKKAKCPFCLVTDAEAWTFDKQGEMTHREDLLAGLSLPANQATWTWKLAPFGEVERNRRTEHRVVGINSPWNP